MTCPKFDPHLPCDIRDSYSVEPMISSCICNSCYCILWFRLCIRDCSHCNLWLCLVHVKKWMFLKFWVVLVVMQLDPSVVATLFSTLTLQKCINRRKVVHGKGLELFHYYVELLGPISHTFSLDFHPCILNLGCWFLWRREAIEPYQGFMRFLTWRRYLYTSSMFNKDVMSIFYPNNCLMYVILKFVIRCIW